MAYIYTYIQQENAKPIPLFCGEATDECFICGKSLNGRDCLRIDYDNILICGPNIQCDSAGEQIEVAP